eukprot:1357879-Rhodomonas_salina.3
MRVRQVGGSLGEWFGDEVPAFVAVALFLALIPLIAVYLPETCPAVTKGIAPPSRARSLCDG